MALDRDPNHVFRDFVTDRVPSSGNWNPRKPEIRQLLTEWWQTLIALVADAGGLELPNLLISMTVVGGNENNIVAAPNLPLPSGPGVALFSLVPRQTNTGDVTINGKPLLTSSGNGIAPEGLSAGTVYMFLDNGTSYRLLSDQTSDSIRDASEAALAAAQAARDAAQGAAETVVAARYNSAAGVQAASISAAVQTVELTGYNSPGDGLGGMYKRVSSEPSHPFKLQSLDGAWWELVGTLANPSGTVTSPNFIFGQNFNLLNPNVASSSVFGGTTTQPNAIGFQIHRQTFVGDGSTRNFTVTAPFVINDLDRFNVRVNVKTLAGGLFNYSEGAGFEVLSGYGTSTIIVGLDVAPANGTTVEVTIVGEAPAAISPIDLVRTAGYDNVVNARMSNVDGAHQIVFPGGGHNAILGGSFSRAGGSYNTVLGGKTQWIGLENPDTFGCWSCGNGNVVDGSTSGAFGDNNKVNGFGVVAIGRDHLAAMSDVLVSGRRGLAYAQGERIHSGGKAADTEPGLHQVRELVLGGTTNNDTTVGLTNTGNTTTQAQPARSAALLRVEIAAIKDDFSKMASFAGDFLLTVDGSGVARINNSVADVAVGAVSSIGDPTYLAFVRGISGGLQVRVKGASGENVRWTAAAKLVQVRYS